MDRRERYLDEEEMLRLVMQALQARMWTGLPGIVNKYPGSAGANMTVDVQPAINGRLRTAIGTYESIQMPVLLDCPILWQGGGGATFTFPIKEGDECFVVFSSRCIDAWWSQGGVRDAPEIRMHNLSDGFALIGVKSLPNSYAIDTEAATLRSDDGETYFKLNPTAQTFEVVAPGGITMNGVTIDSAGNVDSPGTIHGDIDVIADTISGKTHTHSDPQGGDVGPPI